MWARVAHAQRMYGSEDNFMELLSPFSSRRSPPWPHWQRVEVLKMISAEAHSVPIPFVPQAYHRDTLLTLLLYPAHMP